MNHPVSDMFEPDEETMVLEIVRGFFAIPSEEMMKIGDLDQKSALQPGGRKRGGSDGKAQGGAERNASRACFIDRHVRIRPSALQPCPAD